MWYTFHLYATHSHHQQEQCNWSRCTTIHGCSCTPRNPSPMKLNCFKLNCFKIILITQCLCWTYFLHRNSFRCLSLPRHCHPTRSASLKCCWGRRDKNMSLLCCCHLQKKKWNVISSKMRKMSDDTQASQQAKKKEEKCKNKKLESNGFCFMHWLWRLSIGGTVPWGALCRRNNNENHNKSARHWPVNVWPSNCKRLCERNSVASNYPGVYRYRLVLGTRHPNKANGLTIICCQPSREQVMQLRRQYIKVWMHFDYWCWC